MMRPKIISPHLVLVARFSVDIEGKYAISRAPLLYPKEEGAEEDLLQFFVAVLNSSPCFWYIATHSHKYRGGYVMLEPKTLLQTPVPDPSIIPPKEMRSILDLVDKRLTLSGEQAIAVEGQLDELVAKLYGLSAREIEALGIGQ